MKIRALRAEKVLPSAEDAIRALRFETVELPPPKPGQVLVKMRAAPCNPADLLWLTGRYGIDRPLPATPGFEGSGEVVSSGGGILGRWLVGKRVACGGHEGSGTWAEYCVTDATQCLALGRRLSFEQGATAVANPMTALSLVGLARRGGHRAIVQTAAGGQLGRMIAAVAKREGFAVIDVVRRSAQAAALRSKGSDALASEDPDFDEALAKKSREARATIALDAVAGPMTGRLAGALPKGSEIVIYGALDETPSGGIDPMELAFGAKRIRGFEIAGHLREIGMLGAFRLATAAQRLVVEGLATSEVRKSVPLETGPAALVEYVREMSAGKILLLASPA